MQLATFALAARGLGLEDFGYFSVLVAQIMLFTGLAAFESNQAVVRFGVDHLASVNVRGFQALIKAGTLLDLGAAGVAMMAALALPLLIGPAIGWDARIIADAQLIAPLALANAIATPKGMLRLFGRFGLLTVHAVVTPAVRLLGCGTAWWFSAGLTTYLLVWLVAGWLGAVVAFWFAWREAHRRDLLRGMTLSLKHLSAENDGMWRYTIFPNLHSSVSLIPSQGATFIVGVLMGPAAAGLFKIARELGVAMAKPIDLINQALFPDISRLVRGGEWARLRRTAVRAGLLAGGTGLAVTIIALVLGGPLIDFLFGRSFVAAAPLLIVLCLATAVRMIAFPADPILYALHKPQVALLIAIGTSLLFLLLLIVWADKGVIAAGLAFLAMNVAATFLSTGAATMCTRQIQNRAR